MNRENKTNMNIEDPAKMLESIGRVEAPPFLLTRIRQKISEQSERKVNPLTVVAAGISLTVLFAMNIYIISNSGQNRTRATEDIANAMNLYPNNNIYR
jgi:hypothetical protein